MLHGVSIMSERYWEGPVTESFLNHNLRSKSWYYIRSLKKLVSGSLTETLIENTHYSIHKNKEVIVYISDHNVLLSNIFVLQDPVGLKRQLSINLLYIVHSCTTKSCQTVKFIINLWKLPWVISIVKMDYPWSNGFPQACPDCVSVFLYCIGSTGIWSMEERHR